MIIIKTPKEISLMKEGGKILADILDKVSDTVTSGISTLELDRLAKKLIREAGGDPAFLNYTVEGEEDNPYPGTLCTSVNSEVVHGVPSKNMILKEGDIIGLDIGMFYKGLCTDMAKTVGVGKISEDIQKLLYVTEKALKKGISQVKSGVHIGNIGSAIQQYVEEEGFSVVKQLVGHGVGKEVHEEPRVPNYGKSGTGIKLEEGMTLAIEPMVNVGDELVQTEDDRWTITTVDKSLSAHFEHTIAVTKNGCSILTEK
ncbi:type I methionyl aminopeptidase [Patescibacteria group bacterium]|nr:type I methionyl aminopeptidase [Patescibacteria group bacterium]MBU1951417.1 type I methionyl aminopeptidase [Patescibacteria group bacterium]